MKHFLVLLAAALFGIAALSNSKSTTALTGKVMDETGEALIGATIKVLRDTTLVRGTITDYNGDYRLTLDPGSYDVEVGYTGFKMQKVTGVRVISNTLNTLDFTLVAGSELSEVTVTAFKIPLIEQDKTQGGQALTSEQIKNLPTRSVKEIVATTAGTTSIDGGAVNIKGSRKDATDYYIDGVRVSGAPPPVMDVKPALLMSDTREEIAFSRDDRPTEPPLHPGAPPQPGPRAGLLTGGEWNDLHNWNTHWADLLKDGEIDSYQRMYKFFPKNRYSVLLQTEEGLPISDVAVQLHDKSGTLVWETRTSNTGSAELWVGFFEEKAAESVYTLTAEIDGKRHALGIAKAFSEGVNQYKIKRECGHSKTVDIVWTVDATGSMGDELEYLKTELLDVIGRVQAANPGLDVRTGSVFYRDQGDDYVVKSSALNRDISKTVDYIRKQSAGGGGDYPEAVHSALEETLRQPWSREAVARICFLVLDASPHQNPEVLESLQKSIREAAKRGIRIVPLSASGIQKDTEFLMKFFGMATNGSYVFLTDHSGIGGKHLEPTTDEYKVEQLNDLLVRLITEYTSVPTCEGQSSILFAADRHDQQQGQHPKPVLYYPNPAVSRFNLELPFDAEKVTLYDAAGQAVHNLATVQAGLHSIPVHNLPPGFYTLRIWKNGQVQSGKVMVVRT
jgi:hypothetical protein